MWGSPLRVRPSDAGAEDVIRRWYNGTGNELLGDIVIHPFDGNVVVCAWNENSGVAIPMERYNPYASSFFLFYTYNVFTHELTVWGGLTWNALYRMGGRVERKTDLVQNRAFPLVWERELIPSCPQQHPCTRWFLPIQVPRSADCAFPSATLYQICHRMEWVLGTRVDPPQEDATSAAALGLYECTITNLQRRVDFSKRRLFMEKARFDELFANMTERDVLQLFANNGLEEYMNEAMMEDPTPVDMYWFWRRYSAPPPAPPKGGPGNLPLDFPPPPAGGSPKPPTVVFRVAIEECPIQLPLQGRGLVHLTYKEVAAWVWHLFVTQTQQLAFRGLTLPPEESRWIDLLDNLMEGRDLWPYVPKIERVSDSHPYRRMTTGPMLLLQQQHQEGADFTFTNVDMEDLANNAPPCVSNCMRAAQFPKNDQRLRLVPIFQESHISQADTFNWFEAKHAAYPHPAYANAQARMDYVGIWNKKRGKTYCANIVRDTRAGNNAATHLVCPHAHLADYRAACAPGQRVDFSGPHNLIKRYLGRKKKNL